MLQQFPLFGFPVHNFSLSLFCCLSLSHTLSSFHSKGLKLCFLTHENSHSRTQKLKHTRSLSLFRLLSKTLIITPSVFLPLSFISLSFSLFHSLFQTSIILSLSLTHPPFSHSKPLSSKRCKTEFNFLNCSRLDSEIASQ